MLVSSEIFSGKYFVLKYFLVGLDGREAEEYKYLSGRCRHYKLIGETHGTAGPNHPVVRRNLSLVKVRRDCALIGWIMMLLIPAFLNHVSCVFMA